MARKIPVGLMERIAEKLSEVDYGSIEIILNGPVERIDILTHHRERFIAEKDQASFSEASSRKG